MKARESIGAVSPLMYAMLTEKKKRNIRSGIIRTAIGAAAVLAAGYLIFSGIDALFKLFGLN